MATGSKAGLYQNAQSASYLPLTLVVRGLNLNGYMEDFLVMSKIGQRNLDITNTLSLP